MINIFSHDYRVRIAKTDLDISKVKLIDDLAFVGHRGITEEELCQVREHGVLLVLYHLNTGYVVGEAQLLFKEIPEIPHCFEPPVGYCYGVAVRPSFQKHGLGKVLMESVWNISVEHGVKEIHLSVRVENYSSLKLMFGQGYEIFDYREDFYGPNKVEGPRLMMRKIQGKQGEGPNLELFVPVPFDTFNENAHIMIAENIKNGHIGVGISCKGIHFA